MKILVLISRLIVGSLFIVSGLVKANDPLGLSYKLQEYFSADVFDWPSFEPWAFTLAALLVIGEVVLGVAVLIGGKMKLTTWTLLGLTVVFGFLTWYSWVFDAVKDCGCFGDALKDSIGRSLTPFESFMKDMILLVFIVIMIIGQSITGWLKLNTKKEDMILLPISLVLIALLGWGLFGWPFTIIFTAVNFVFYLGLKKMLSHWKPYEWLIAVMVVFLASFFTNWNYNHLPVKDFRPYHVGASIPEGLKTCDELGLPCPESTPVYIMTNKVTGESMEMLGSEYLEQKIWEDKDWEITETLEDPVILVDGYEPPIHDFEFSDVDGNEVTHALISDPNYSLLVVSYDLTHLGIFERKVVNDYEELTFTPDIFAINAFEELNVLSEKFKAAGFKVHGATSGTWEQMDVMRHSLQIQFPWLQGDGIMLKTIVRASPGILLLKNGVIVGKWHYNDLPSYEEMQTAYMK